MYYKTDYHAAPHCCWWGGGLSSLVAVSTMQVVFASMTLEMGSSLWPQVVGRHHCHCHCWWPHQWHRWWWLHQWCRWWLHRQCWWWGHHHCQNWFFQQTSMGVEISPKGCRWQAERFEDFGFSVCAAPLRYLRPCISEDKGSERQRSDEGRSCQKAEETEENRGEFTGSIQADIWTKGQSPQRVEYLYFTMDMYSNREVEKDIVET